MYTGENSLRNGGQSQAISKRQYGKVEGEVRDIDSREGICNFNTVKKRTVRQVRLIVSCKMGRRVGEAVGGSEERSLYSSSSSALAALSSFFSFLFCEWIGVRLSVVR